MQTTRCENYTCVVPPVCKAYVITNPADAAGMLGERMQMSAVEVIIIVVKKSKRYLARPRCARNSWDENIAKF